MAQDKNGAIWLGMENGLVKYNLQNEMNDNDIKIILTSLYMIVERFIVDGYYETYFYINEMLYMWTS